jgi:hypothetical protein
MAASRKLIDRGDRVPQLRLDPASGGPPRSLRLAPKSASIVLLLPDASETWRVPVQDLASASEQIEQWYSEIVVVVPGSRDEVRALAVLTEGKIATLADPEGRAAAALGVPPSRAVLIVADRWGEVYHVEEVAQPEELSPVAEIEEWAKFLATQCPECGVIDESGHGEWALI